MGKEADLGGAAVGGDLLGDEMASEAECGKGAWAYWDGDELLGPPRRRALMPEKRLDMVERRGAKAAGCSKTEGGPQTGLSSLVTGSLVEGRGKK